MFIFFALLLYCFPSPRCAWFCGGCFRQVFFHLRDKKVVTGRVRQLVALYSNDCMEICLGGLSIGGLKQVVV